MEIVQQFLQQHAGGLVSQLVERLGFEPEQAQQFVPVVAEKLVSALSGGGFDVGSLLGGGDLSSLMGKLDLPGIAQASGVDEAKARSGVEAIGPQMLSALGEQAGGVDGLLGALGGENAGGLLGAASKLGNVFKLK